MDSKDDEDISIDFSRVKEFFKGDKNEEKKVDDASIKSAPEATHAADAAAEPHSYHEEKNDDEVSIDFSRVKEFFKGDKNEEPKHEWRRAEHKNEGEDAELSFDFSKIKDIFKSDKKDDTRNDDGISINWGKTLDFFKKYGIVFIALIPIILAIYIRMQTQFLPITDDWAANSVMNGIRSQIRASIDQQYPNLPDTNKNTIVDTEMQKVISQNSQQISQQIKSTSAYFKTFFQDESGKNYMPDIDPWYFVRYAQNILDHGYPGDTLKDGKPFDNHQLAPLGRPVTFDMFHPYFLAYFYKFMHFFIQDITLMRSSFYYPILVSSLIVLIVFLIARKMAGNIGGFFAGLMIAVYAPLLEHTLLGHAGSKAWTVFFPVVITWLFVETMDSDSIVRNTVLSVIAGFLSGLFAFAWSGWWYIFDFLLVTIALTFLYLTLTNIFEVKKNVRFIFEDKTIRNLLIVGIVYFISTAVFTVTIVGWSNFRDSVTGPFGFKSLKAPLVSADIWPNVLTTVAELNEGSINGIIDQIGGPFFFFISLMGLIFAVSREEGFKKFDFYYIGATAIFYGAYFLVKRVGIDVSAFGLFVWIMLPIIARIIISVYKKDSSYDFRLSILLTLWFVSTIYASLKGIRFALLLAPAFSIAFGVALGKTYVYLSRYLTKELKIQKFITGSILILLLLLVYASPIKGAVRIASSDLPLVNDAWYNTLTSIKQKSSQDAIITSWWDFGHHFKAIADRRVTFDGTTQAYPPAHWVGKLLMTDNETEAIGILRMLDCGQNSAYYELVGINNDPHKSLKILDEIFVLDKEKAGKKLLGYGLTEAQAEKILLYTHCNPPEGYFIASDDMIGKSGVWSHFGIWNYERADLWKYARVMPQEKAVDYMMNKFNYSKEKAENTYFEMQAITTDSEANTWVAPWPGYGGTISCSKDKNGIYACSNGFQINLRNHDIFAIGQQGIVRPKIAVFTTEDSVLKKEFNGTTVDIGTTIIPKSKTEVEVVLSSKELAGSMFTRMFYMNGHGLRYFKPFSHQHGLTGTDIYTYKTDWEGTNTTIITEYGNYLNPAKEQTNAGNATGMASENISNVSTNSTKNTTANIS